MACGSLGDMDKILEYTLLPKTKEAVGPQVVSESGDNWRALWITWAIGMVGAVAWYVWEVL